MSPRLLAQLIAGSRVVIGIALIAAPSRVTNRWVGERESAHAGTRVMAGGLGARDVALGAGTLAALSAGGDALKPWLAGSAVADLVDLASALRAAGELPKAGVAGTVLVAGGAAAAGFYLLSQADEL